MRAPIYCFLFCAVAFLFSSCVTTSQSNRLEQIPNSIRKGQSTKSDVIRLLGQPNQKEITPNGEVWEYGSTKRNDVGDALTRQAIGVGLSQIPHAGRIASIARAAAPSEPEGNGARIFFSPSGVVSNYSVILR